MSAIVRSAKLHWRFYIALINAFWAICLLDQNAVVIDRISL
jgi:hypothetical protein